MKIYYGHFNHFREPYTYGPYSTAQSAKDACQRNTSEPIEWQYNEELDKWHGSTKYAYYSVYSQEVKE